MKITLATALLLVAPLALHAQEEGSRPTQALLRADSKAEALPTLTAVQLSLDGKSTSVTSLNALPANGIQVALLIDDGLSRNAGIQLNDIKKFVTSIRPGTEVLVGYMSNGSVRATTPGFTTDLAAASASVRLPFSGVGQSASPYFCLSDFVKHWPGSRTSAPESSVGFSEDSPSAGRAKARFVIMITNGVDPYNGSTSIANQDSPYVQAAIDDANRAGVAVYSVYYPDAGFRGRGSFSGQSYLQQVAESTGGETFYQGSFAPVSLAPYLAQFNHAIAETYVATFPASGGGRDHLVRLKVNTSTPQLKLRHADAVRPGNQESPTQ